MKVLLKTLKKNFLIGLKTKKENKWLSLSVSLLGVLLTLAFLNNIRSKDSTDTVPLYLDSLLNNKNAITISLKIENVPLEFLYPGLKVDIIKQDTEKTKLVAKNIPVLGVSILDSETVRLVFAVEDGEEKQILANKNKELFVVLVNKKHRAHKVEIIEVQ